MKENLLALLVCMLIIGCIHAQKELNLLPNVPMSDSNPYWQELYNQVKPDAPDPKKVSFAEADEMMAASYAYLHPQSKLKGNKTVAERLIVLIDSSLTIWSRGQNLGDMSYAYQVGQAYYMLKLYAPNVLPNEKLAIWNKGLELQTEKNLTNTAIYDSLKVSNLWLNGEIRKCLGVYFAGKILNNPTWVSKAYNVMENLIPQSLINGGGTHYCYFHTESPTYHYDSKLFIYLWYIMSGSQKYKEMLEKMTPFPVTAVHLVGKGFVEYSSSTPWKPYYAPHHVPKRLDYAAEISALMFGDPYSWTLAKCISDKNWYAAFIYRTGLTEKKLPDNFVMYDEGIIGPRGRFGRWGYVGIAREYSTGLPEVTTTDIGLNPIKATYAGAYILKDNPTMDEYPLNAAFHSCMPCIKVAKGKESNLTEGKECAYLSTDEKNSLIKNKELYSIASTYSIRGGLSGVKSTHWGGMQQWVYTPNRIIGLLTVRANKENKVFGLSNLIKLVSGEGKKMPAKDVKELIKVDSKTYRYGDLNIAIHDQNYNGAYTHYYGDIMTPLYKVENGKGCCMFELHDEKDFNTDSLITYPAGYEKYVLVEVTPQGTSMSKTPIFINTNNPNLKSFEFQEKNRAIRIVHNCGTQKETFTLNLNAPYGKCFIEKSWNDQAIKLKGKSIVQNIEIPANQHLLIISSETFDTKYDTFNNIFK